MVEYHETAQDISEESRDLHRALQSLAEELQAVDWYQQRVSASKEESLRAVLAHNRDDEIEHSSMLIEWLRRHYPKWNENLRKFLFTEAPIVDIEKRIELANNPGDLRLRGMKEGNHDGSA